MESRLSKAKGLYRRGVKGILSGKKAQPVEEPTASLPIPEDVLYLIIDNHLDTSTIKALSLTCRALASYCRKALWKEVRLATVRYQEEDGPFERFAAFLKENPGVVGLVEDLQIMDRHSTIGFVPGRDSVFGIPSWKRGPTGAICVILTQDWGCLRRLRLRVHGSWNGMPKMMQKALTHIFKTPTLQELTLSGLNLPASVLFVAANVHKLELLQDCHIHIPPPTSAAHVSPLAPHTLVVRTRTLPEFQALLGSRSPFQLTRLSTLDFDAPRTTVGDFLRTLPVTTAGNLRTLKVSLLHLEYADDGTGPQPPSLHAFKDLEDIGISEDAGADGKMGLGWILPMLKSLPPSARLRSIELSFRYDQPEHVLKGAWQELDLLIQRRWPELNALTVVGYSRYSPQMDWHRMDFFQKNLPPLLPSLRSGVLRSSIKFAFETWR